MTIFFNTTRHNEFTIADFALSKPVQLQFQNQYLCCHPRHTAVYFSKESTKWVIEKDDEHYYIRTNEQCINKTQYLGAPNKSGDVFLYTSKNRFTRWSTQKENTVYQIRYVGEKFNPQEICIVVARFYESVEWLKAYADIAIVYNKGSPIKESLKVDKLGNIGREGHTYLHHIITQYNSHTDYTIFLHADPFPHNPTILYGIDNYERTLDIQPLGLRYLHDKNIPPHKLIEDNKTCTEFGLEYLTIAIDGNLRTPLYDDEGIDNIVIQYRHCNRNSDETIVENFLRRATIPSKGVDRTLFSYAGLFSVKRHLLLQYNLNQYDKLMSALLEHDWQGSAEGYVLERLWLYIFTPT